MNAATGAGAPMSDQWFDGALPRAGLPDVVQPQGTPFFQGTAPAVSGAFVPINAQDAKQIINTYQGIPGGIVLEDAATGLGNITKVTFDKRFDAFVLDDRAIYLTKVPPKTVAVLCRAIADDDKVGVSIGQKQIVYGQVPVDSELAMDMKIADRFLGDIVFAEKDWSVGYRFANDYVPQRHEGRIPNVAVFFKFNGFQFAIVQEEVRLTQAKLDVRLVPLSDIESPDGGLQPDYNAIEKGQLFPEFQANARHVADNIAYYRRELIIDRMFAYGELAAFIRGLKAAGVDLKALALSIES
ncbi:MAG: hypothetical protein ABSB74_20675 [Tepidisphaeraceae bacterium]